MTGRRIPEAVKQKIIQEYVDNKPAFLTLAARHNVSYVSVRKILHDAEVVDPGKTRGILATASCRNRATWG